MRFLPLEKLYELYPHGHKGVLLFLSQEGGSFEFTRFDITTSLRYAHFMAQMAHETGGFKYTREIISGPKAEIKYGATTRVGKILGNTQVGDGAKYIGRGIVQLTGRWNYRRASKAMGIDLINKPEQLEVPDKAVEIGMVYWNWRGLNKYADSDNLKEITRRLNGGYNGLESRAYELKKLKRALDI